MSVLVVRCQLCVYGLKHRKLLFVGLVVGMFRVIIAPLETY